MKIIRTLGGDISPDQLGAVYYHEHVIARSPVTGKRDEDLELCDVEKMVEEMKLFREAGGTLLTDASISDFGENAHLRLEISEKSGVPVVGTVGFGQKEHHSEAVRNSTTEVLYERVMDAAVNGYGRMRLKPGQLKFGTSYGFISDSEKRCARAVARAQKELEMPLFTHTGIGTMGLAQIALLKEEGANLEQVCIGHMDRNPDPWLCKELLRKGVYLGLDQISKIKYCTEQTRIDLIRELIRCGYQKKILLCGDMARQSYLTSFGGGPGFRYILESFLPRLVRQLMEEGMAEERAMEIREDLICHNPKRYLSFNGEVCESDWRKRI